MQPHFPFVVPEPSYFEIWNSSSINSNVGKITLKNRGHLTEYRVPLNCSWRGGSDNTLSTQLSTVMSSVALFVLAILATLYETTVQFRIKVIGAETQANL